MFSTPSKFYHSPPTLEDLSARTPGPFELDFARDIIFKGAIVEGINGRKMFETWFKMEALLATGKLNLEPAITHRLKLSEFHQALRLLQSGEAIKVVMRPE